MISKIFRRRSSRQWQDDIYVFWQLLKPYTWRLAAALLCGVLLSGVNGAIAWSVKPALDLIFIKKAAGYLFLLPAAVIILFLLRGVFTYLNSYLMSSIGAKIVKSLRQGLYERLLVLPLSFYSKTSSGSVVSKTLNDIGILHNTVAHTMKDFIVGAGTVIVLAVVAITRRWDLALLSFIVIPLIIYSIGKLGERMKNTSLNTMILFSKITTILHESLQGIKLIKAFRMEKEMASRYGNALTEHYRSTMREIRINEFSSLLAGVLGGVGVAVILLYGGHLVISDKISAGAFFSFTTAILMMYTPLKRLSKVHNSFQQGRNVIERLREIVLVVPEKEGGIERNIKGHILFKNVSFRYPSAEDYALKDINLEVRPGETIALVGSSGGGKTTLVDLIAGFWQPTEGEIFIDGVSLRDLSLHSLRRHLGIVTQDVVLFDETVKANILFGKPDATDEEVAMAAKAAHCDFITELPEGYDTKIGERGVRLSGGQKQRLSIARAILKNPPILILDEATSSLDTSSEMMVQKALENLMKDRTTFVIAHRLSTVRRATRIIVLHRGRIVESGKHDELIKVDGIYKRLYMLQLYDSTDELPKPYELKRA